MLQFSILISYGLPRVASNSRNDNSFFRHCEEQGDKAIHKPRTTTPSSLRGARRQSNPQTHPPLRHCEQSEAIHKPQKVNTKNKKEKEITIIYQIKELIFNEILIFNFQFSISYASFVSHFVGRQAKMIKQAYHFPTLCFNFQF